MSQKSKTPRKPSASGRARRSETPQVIPEGDESAGTSQGPSIGSQSALSPSQKIRVEEKEELKNLNTRLAAYIDRVKSLQEENRRLTTLVTSKEEVVTREVTAVKVTYEKELNDVKGQLDSAIKERAALQVDQRDLRTSNDELKEANKRLERDAAKRESELKTAQARANELSGKMATVQAEADHVRAEHKRLREKLEEAKKDLEAARREVAETRSALNKADLKRVEIEARCQGVSDELELAKNIHEQQLREVRFSKKTETSEVDSGMGEQNGTYTEDMVMDLREQYEDMFRGAREDLEKLYEDKMTKMKGDYERKISGLNSQANEVRQLKTRLDSVTRRIAEKEDEVRKNEARIRDLELQVETERDNYGVMLVEKEDANDELKKQVKDLTKQLHDLMDVNIKLDAEIAMYRQLLEEEESRLNLTPGAEGSRRKRPRLSKPRTPARPEQGSSPLSRIWPLSRSSQVDPRSRKRTLHTMEAESESFDDVRRSATATGDVEIVDVDAGGSYVRVRNKGTNDVPMSGYSLKHLAADVTAAGDGALVYKFPRINLKAGAETTVWSGDTNAAHQAPDSLVMKNMKWSASKNTQTVLLDANDAEIATYEMTHDTSTRTGSSSSVRVEQDLHHQEANQQCCVM